MSDVRRTVRYLPAFVACLSVAGVAWLLGVGCGWDYSVAANVEAGADSTADTAVAIDSTPTDAEYTLADGRVCRGHDEDGDGIPDECDNCPNVSNPDQLGNAVGSACTSSFITMPTRLLFDPFTTSFSSWTTHGSGAGAFAPGDDGDSFKGGSATGDELRFITYAAGAAASAVVVTTTMTIVEDSPGSAGILLRVNGDPAKFYLCAASISNGFAAAHAPDAGCSGDLCAPSLFSVPSGDASVGAGAPIPSDIPHARGKTVGIRASVTSGTSGDAGSTSGTFECRVFDPADPSTLASKDSRYFLSVPISGSRWYASGDIGLYAQKASAVFGSVDVLRSP